MSVEISIETQTKLDTIHNNTLERIGALNSELMRALSGISDECFALARTSEWDDALGADVHQAVRNQLGKAERDLRLAINTMHQVLAESARAVHYMRFVRAVPTINVEKVRAGLAREHSYVKP